MIKIKHSRPTLEKRQESRSAYRARTDSKTSETVEKAVELQSVAGTVVAAGFLQGRSVPLNVIDRVLLKSRRRNNRT